MGTPGTDGTATFTYDPIGRITGYDSPLGTSTDQAYGWQKIPNRDSLTVGTGSPVTTTFDDADRITSSGFSHDADGRMAARPGQQFVWDSLGRLTTVKDSGGTTIAAYTYDALDRLREVTRSGTTLRFRYLGMTTQRLQNRNVTTSTSGRKVAWDRMGTMLADYNGVDSGVRYYGTNGHRDTAWIADGTGAVTATVRYDPWGSIIASSGTTPDWRFQGSWYDTSTDLQWVVTRWYAPTLGRFISEDTLLGEPTNPKSRHLYAYAEGDPVNGWDPDGRRRYTFREDRITGGWEDVRCPGASNAIVYEHAHYRGNKVRICAPINDFCFLPPSDKMNWNVPCDLFPFDKVHRPGHQDRTSSVKIVGLPSAGCLILYEDNDYKGKKRIIRFSTPYLGSFNDLVSSALFARGFPCNDR